MIFQNGQFVLMRRHFQLQRGLQARQDVVRYFKSGLVTVHGDGSAELLMSVNLYAGYDGLDITAMIE